MSITFTLTPRTKSAVLQAKNLGKISQKSLKNALFKIGNYFKEYAEKDLLYKPKSGKKYKVKIDGVIMAHTASKAGEPPANMTGRLKNSLAFNVTGSNEIRFGAGGEDSGVIYAKFLELGTKKMAKRPFLVKSINDNARNVVVTIQSELQKELKNLES